jgi:hypothetical protein
MFGVQQWSGLQRPNLVINKIGKEKFFLALFRTNGRLSFFDYTSEYFANQGQKIYIIFLNAKFHLFSFFENFPKIRCQACEIRVDKPTTP